MPKTWRDALTFTFKWIVNDELRPEEASSTFHPEGLSRGDRLAVEVIPHDGKVSGSPVRSGSVVVGNTSPAIRTLTIQPSGAKVGDPLVATVDGATSMETTSAIRTGGPTIIKSSQRANRNAGHHRFLAWRCHCCFRHTS